MPFGAVFPQTQVQLCIVHRVLNSLRFVAWKRSETYCDEISRKSTNQSLLPKPKRNLKLLLKLGTAKYPSISQSWRDHWPNLITFFDYSDQIQKDYLYPLMPLNPWIVWLESDHARKTFPNDQSAMKVIYLAIESASKKCLCRLRDWKPAINQFMTMYQDRMPNFI